MTQASYPERLWSLLLGDLQEPPGCGPEHPTLGVRAWGLLCLGQVASLTILCDSVFTFPNRIHQITDHIQLQNFNRRWICFCCCCFWKVKIGSILKLIIFKWLKFVLPLHHINQLKSWSHLCIRVYLSYPILSFNYRKKDGKCLYSEGFCLFVCLFVSWLFVLFLAKL